MQDVISYMTVLALIPSYALAQSSHGTGANTELLSIAQVESSSGRNINHRVVGHGLNKGHRAAGWTGIMPITVCETIRKNPKLFKYSFLTEASPNSITNYLNTHADTELEIATAHWKRLSNLFGNDFKRKAYAWNHGISATKRAVQAEIDSDGYVQKAVTAALFRFLKQGVVTHDQTPVLALSLCCH